jgi:hypothetical protein
MEVGRHFYALAALPLGKEGWCSGDRKLGGLSSRSQREKFPAPAGNRTPAVQPVDQPLYRLTSFIKMTVCKIAVRGSILGRD